MDSELELVENQLIDYSGLLSVARGTGTPFTIKLRPRSVSTIVLHSYMMYSMVYM